MIEGLGWASVVNGHLNSIHGVVAAPNIAFRFAVVGGRAVQWWLSGAEPARKRMEYLAAHAVTSVGPGGSLYVPTARLALSVRTE